MAPRKKRKTLSSPAKQSCYLKNKNQAKYYEDFLKEHSDIDEEYLDSVFDATRNANKKSCICSFTIKAGELGLAAVDVRDFSDISFAHSFSSEVNVLLGDFNAVCEEKNQKQLPKGCKKTSSGMQEPQKFKEVKVLQHPADVTALSYTNKNLLLSCSLDGTVKVWDRNYRLLQSFTDTMKSPSDIHASSKLDYFATSSLCGTRSEKGGMLYGASLFSFSRKDPILSLTGHTSATQCVRFHANGMYLATASPDGTVMMWSTQSSGQPVRTFRDGTPHHRKAIAFSPDGKYLASTHCGSANIWDLASGRLLKTLQGSPTPQQPSRHLCFDRQLAVGSADGHLTMWDVHSDQSFSESHFLERPILRLGCSDGVYYTCVC